MAPEIAVVITCVALLIWDNSREDEVKEIVDETLKSSKR